MNGEIPCASIASTRPSIFMIPNSVAIALPLRTITTMPTSTGLSSRATTATSSGPSICDCPACSTQNASCTTTVIPTKTATPQTSPTDSTPIATTCRTNAPRTVCTQYRG